MRNQKKRLLRTPKYKIPIGEPIKRDDGTYALRIKKANSQEVEDIAIDDLFAMAIKATGGARQAGSPGMRASASHT